MYVYRIIAPHSELSEHLEGLVGCTIKIATISGRQEDWRYKGKEVRPQQTLQPGVQHTLWWLQKKLHRWDRKRTPQIINQPTPESSPTSLLEYLHFSRLHRWPSLQMTPVVHHKARPAPTTKDNGWSNVPPFNKQVQHCNGEPRTTQGRRLPNCWPLSTCLYTSLYTEAIQRKDLHWV